MFDNGGRGRRGALHTLPIPTSSSPREEDYQLSKDTVGERGRTLLQLQAVQRGCVAGAPLTSGE